MSSRNAASAQTQTPPASPGGPKVSAPAELSTPPKLALLAEEKTEEGVASSASTASVSAPSTSGISEQPTQDPSAALTTETSLSTGALPAATEMPILAPVEAGEASIGASPVTKLHVAGNSVVAISCDQSQTLYQIVVTPEVTKLVSESRPGTLPRGPSIARLGEPFDHSIAVSEANFAVSPDKKMTLACGYWDNSFKCFSVDGGRHLQSVFGHTSCVTCIDISASGRVIVTGGRDCAVYVWSVDQLAVSTEPRAVLVGHQQPIIGVAVDDEHDLVLSSSQDACLVHNMAGDLLHVVVHPTLKRAHLLRFRPDGSFLVHYRDRTAPSIALYSINARLLATATLEEQLMDMFLSKSGDVVLTGGFGRSLTLFRCYDLAVISRSPLCDSSVRSVVLSADNTFALAGFASGRVALFRVPPGSALGL